MIQFYLIGRKFILRMITRSQDDNTAALTRIIECNWLRLMTDVYHQIRKEGGERGTIEERMVRSGRGRETAEKGARLCEGRGG